MKTKIFNFLIIALIIIFLGKNIFQNKQNFVYQYNHKQLKTLYNQSQFAEKPEDRKKIIKDYQLYSYAGWKYLKTGNLTQINIEHPPLGKYLIGLSIILFQNPNIGQVFWGIIFLVLLFMTARKSMNPIPALVVVFLFSLEKLFIEQITRSFLDLSLGVFLLLLFLTTLNEKKQNFFNSFKQGLFLGAAASIKYPTIAVICFFCLTIYYFIKKSRRKLKKLLIIAGTASSVFLLSYLPFFIKNPSIQKFIRLQTKAVKIHLSHLPEYPKGQVFKVLFLNQWRSWWGEKNLIKTAEWNLFWPILTLNFCINLLLFKKLFKKNILINLWVFFYFLLLSSRVFFPRYLFLLLPFLYILLCYNVKTLMVNNQQNAKI